MKADAEWSIDAAAVCDETLVTDCVAESFSRTLRERDRAIEEVRLAVGCVGPMALRLTDLEAKIRGVVPSDSRKIIRESKAYLKKTLEPIDDLLGSAEYKVYIAGVLLERALAQALENVEKKQDGRNG